MFGSTKLVESGLAIKSILQVQTINHVFYVVKRIAFLHSEKQPSIQNGTGKRYSQRCVVKCVAANYHVFVHPMCVLVSSLAWRTSTLPILFCGIYNPARERSFYGLYPGGKHIDTETLRLKPV